MSRDTVRLFSVADAAFGGQQYAHGLEWSLADFNAALAADDGLEHRNGHTVPSHLTHFASLEQGATELRCWEPLAVSGLLQTPAYARFVESLDGPPERDLVRRVEFRLARQQALTRLRPLHLYALLDSSVLRRIVGSVEIMREQVSHLVEMAQLPNVHVRVAPLDGRVLIAPGAFRLFTGEAGRPYLATTESLDGFSYLERPSIVQAYESLFERLWESSHAMEEVDVQHHER